VTVELALFGETLAFDETLEEVTVEVTVELVLFDETLAFDETVAFDGRLLALEAWGVASCILYRPCRYSACIYRSTSNCHILLFRSKEDHIVVSPLKFRPVTNTRSSAEGAGCD
jgi:hypothetical protein